MKRNAVVKKNDKTAVNLLYIFLFVFCMISYYTFSYSDWSDLTVNIARANGLKMYTSLSEVVNYSVEEQYDFVFTALMWIVVTLGIDIKLLFVLILFFFFYSIIDILKRSVPEPFLYHRSDNLLMILYTLFSCPFIFIHGITRNLLAVSLLFWSYLFLKNKRWLLGTLFSFFSLITHASVILYVFVLFLALFLPRFKFSYLAEKTVLIALLLLSIASPFLILGYIVPLIAEHMISDSAHYMNYANYSEGFVSTFWADPGLNAGIKIPTLCTFLISIALLFINKKRDFSYWILYISTILFSFFSQSSTVFAERCLIFMPLLIGSSLFSSYKNGSISEKKRLVVLSIIGLLAVTYHFISIRIYFF